ncbi:MULTISPECIES: hypothetical protein [unclassified Mycobacterium]|uniref:hypothetical protein n=1 Tax=unclassified Mycobacterium TaxID=2642494 RepID=UPI0029C73900|nr:MULTISPECIES: hypothetical protein [unclassified Mycobacterium]
MRSPQLRGRALGASVIALGMALAFTPLALADPVEPAPGPGPSPIVVEAAPMGDDATPAAVTACGAFAQALDGTSLYFGDFADSLEGSNYSDPAVESSNSVGRTALRQGAGVALEAANTPGLQPEIASPMRSWSMGATAMLIKMGLRIPGESLNTTAEGMNNSATEAQMACATAGTHA